MKFTRIIRWRSEEICFSLLIYTDNGNRYPFPDAGICLPNDAKVGDFILMSSGEKFTNQAAKEGFMALVLSPVPTLYLSFERWQVSADKLKLL
jgi:hypothetical protein